MLSLKQMIRMWDTGCCASLGVALDKHDNPDHKGSDYTPTYIPAKPGEKNVRSELGYESDWQDVRIVQK
jgi:hypothetical protein